MRRAPASGHGVTGRPGAASGSDGIARLTQHPASAFAAATAGILMHQASLLIAALRVSCMWSGLVARLCTRGRGLKCAHIAFDGGVVHKVAEPWSLQDSCVIRRRRGCGVAEHGVVVVGAYRGWLQLVVVEAHILLCSVVGSIDVVSGGCGFKGLAKPMGLGVDQSPHPSSLQLRGVSTSGSL